MRWTTSMMPTESQHQQPAAASDSSAPLCAIYFSTDSAQRSQNVRRRRRVNDDNMCEYDYCACIIIARRIHPDGERHLGEMCAEHLQTPPNTSNHRFVARQPHTPLN